MPVPDELKIYHIVHVDRLASIIADGGLLCDAEIVQRAAPGTCIGMGSIKERRLNELTLSSHPGLFVGGCVPFYFCPRSVMLYLIYQGNHSELTYRGGQGPIVHLEASLHDAVEWAEEQDKRWAFTLSNAGSRYFEDRCDLDQLSEINWDAVQTTKWAGNGVPRSVKEGKQAEFLIEEFFPWGLVTRIGVKSMAVHNQVRTAFGTTAHKPAVEILDKWYY
jgi:hypothetical protein